MSATILRLPQVKTKVGLSRSTIYALITAGLFPRQLKLGPRSIGWNSADIEEWINSRKANSKSNEIGA